MEGTTFIEEHRVNFFVKDRRVVATVTDSTTQPTMFDRIESINFIERTFVSATDGNLPK